MDWTWVTAHTGRLPEYTQSRLLHVCPKSLLEDWLVPESSPFEWHFFNLGLRSFVDLLEVFVLFWHKTFQVPHSLRAEVPTCLHE